MTIKEELIKVIKTSEDPDKLLKLLKPKKKFNEESKIGKEVNRVFRQVQQELKGWVPPPPKMSEDTCTSQRPFTKQQQADAPLREQLFNEDGIRIRDLVGKPSVQSKQSKVKPQVIEQQPPQPGKEQGPITEDQFKELPIREQIFNKDGIRIRDLVGKPSVKETKEVLYTAIANIAEKEIKEIKEIPEEEIEIGLLESVWNYMKDIGFVDFFEGSKEMSKDIAIYIANAIQDERLNEEDMELEADQLEKERLLGVEEVQVPEIDSPVTQNEINKLLGINVSPAEVREMILEVQNEIPQELKGLDAPQEQVNKTIEIVQPESPFSAWGIVGGLSDGLSALFQWLKDHESNYDTPLPHIGIITEPQPQAQFEEDDIPGLEPLPEVQRDPQAFMDRQMLLQQRRELLTMNRFDRARDNVELDELPMDDEILGNGKPQRLDSRVKILIDYYERKRNNMRK